MEREINQAQPFTDQQKELIKKFIETKKELLKDEENEELLDSVGELKIKLRKERLSREDIEKVIEYCERFVEAEQQLETKIEIPTTN
jgi:hypothetical protein